MLTVENRIISGSSASSSHVICNHDWSFLQGDKKHSHTLKAGRHLFPFRLDITGSFPSSLSTSALGGASVAYKLRAIAVRPGFSHNLQAKAPVFILRSLTREALEYQQTLDIESTWPEKLMYAITLPHKAWAAGDTLTAIVKLSPLAKGVYVQAVDSSITETTKIGARGGSARVVASVRHEILDHKAVEVEVASPNQSAATASSTSGTPTAHSTHSPRSSRPASPHSSSSSHPHHHPPQHHHEEQEADLGFESNDVVTYINLSIPRSSAYPFLYSASNATPPTTPPPSASPTLQHALLPLSTNFAASHPTSFSLSSHLTVTPSHGLEPVFISHRIRWVIFIHNKDGHLSELRCSLPIKILDGAFLEESREFTMRARRLLLRTCGFGNVLSRVGEEGSEDEGDEGAGVDEEDGGIRHAEVDRELPSYPAHVRDRVANMYLSETVTMRVSNPWVARIGSASAANRGGARTLSTFELSGQRGSGVSPSDPVSADRSIPHTQPDARRSGRSTPAIQPSQHQVDMMSHLPHSPGESSSLDLVNSELFLSLSLDNEAVRRRTGGVPSSMDGQQSQPHQHQHQSHSHNHQHQQQSRTLRWGSRVGSRVGSRAASPERSALSSVTTNNNDNGPSSLPEGGVCVSPTSVVSSSSSSGSGFTSPFQHLFKATIKPFTALAGHHGHGHRPTHSRSLSTTSLMGLPSTHVAGTANGLGASAINSGRPSALNPDLSLACPPFGIDPISSSVSSSSGGTAPSLSSSSDPDLESTSTYPSHTPSMSTCACPLSHIVQSESQDPTSRVFRAFSVVPDYSIASRGFIGGGVPPLSSMRGLPSYEEAEAQRREREAVQASRDMDVPQTQAQNQVMDGRGSMSEPDLAGRFGHAGVRFESRTQAETSHSMHHGASDVRIMQQLREDGDDDDEDEDDTTGGVGAIQMHTKKARP